MARYVRLLRRARAEEGLEDPLPIFGWYARSVILHAQL